MKLENVAVGDNLMSMSGRSLSNKKSLDVTRVVRETKTQLILSRDRRVKKDTGKQIGTGDSWTSATYWQVYDRVVVDKINKYNFEKEIEYAKKELGSLYNKKVLKRLLSDLESED